MRRNHEFLVQLGLKSADDPIAPNHAPIRKKRKTQKLPRPPPETLRRSHRLAGKSAEYSGQMIDALSDGEDVRREEQMAEVRVAAMTYLKSIRDVALRVAVTDDADAQEWRAEALRRWGPLAGGGKQDRDWKLFVESRLSTPPPVSPLDFLQEYYATDVWRLLVSCLLMSRVSSWNTKHRCISDFFQSYPTPSAFAQEADESKIKTCIHSLGLFPDRLKGLVALTDHFLCGPFDVEHQCRLDSFDVDTDRNSIYKIHGIGDFGRDSYLVFCKDRGATLVLSQGGKPILPFVNWRKSLTTVLRLK